MVGTTCPRPFTTYSGCQKSFRVKTDWGYRALDELLARWVIWRQHSVFMSYSI